MDSDTDDDSDKEALLATATTTATAATNGTNGASSAAEVKGLNPVTVVRRCTDCFWIVPFLLNCAMCGVITWHSDMHANLSALFRLPDFMGHDCGGRFRMDKPYLYFCMEKPSEHIFNEKNKSLDLTHPICVSKCPETFNTSSLCYVGGNTNSSDAWEWVQDYPSQPLAGCICRPHIHFAVNLYKDYDKVLTTAPPNLTVLLYIRNWPIYMLSIFVSICFSIAYILMLSKCARILIWISFLVVAVASGLMCIFFSYHFNTGYFKDVVGHRAGDPIDLMRGVGTFIVFVFSVCQMCSLRSSLDSAGRVLELACQCVLSTPSLVLMPLILALQRTWLLCWWLIVIGNYFTSELQNGETRVKHAVYGTTKQWEYVVIFPTINKFYAVMFTFGLLWFNETNRHHSCRHLCDVLHRPSLAAPQQQQETASPLSDGAGLLHHDTLSLWHCGIGRFPATLLVSAPYHLGFLRGCRNRARRFHPRKLLLLRSGLLSQQHRTLQAGRLARGVFALDVLL